MPSSSFKKGHVLSVLELAGIRQEGITACARQSRAMREIVGVTDDGVSGLVERTHHHPRRAQAWQRL
jgi:hypothetical protein